MKKLLLLPTILVLVSCQPSELDKCIEANMPAELNETERRDIIKNKIRSSKLVFPDKTSQIQFEKIKIGKNYKPRYVSELFWILKDYKSRSPEEVNLLANEIKVYENVYEYSVKYHGTRPEVVDLDANFKKTATSKCNSQGIY